LLKAKIKEQDVFLREKMAVLSQQAEMRINDLIREALKKEKR